MLATSFAVTILLTTYQDSVALGQNNRQKYGLTFSMGFAGRWTVMVGCAKAAMDLLQKEEWKGLVNFNPPSVGKLPNALLRPRI